MTRRKADKIHTFTGLALGRLGGLWRTIVGIVAIARVALPLFRYTTKG